MLTTGPGGSRTATRGARSGAWCSSGGCFGLRKSRVFRIQNDCLVQVFANHASLSSFEAMDFAKYTHLLK